MNLIKKMIRTITPTLSRKNTAVVLASLMVVTVAGVLIPNQERVTNASDNVQCSNGPTDGRPHLNTFPVKWSNNAPVQNSDGTWTCYDFPFMAGRNMNGSFPTSQSQHQNGVNVSAGDVVQIRLYVHNTAPANGPESSNATDVTIDTSYTNGSGTATVRASAHASNASERPSGSVKVNLPANTRLSLIPNSGVIQHYSGAYGRTDFQIGDNSVMLFPDLEGCYEKSKFVYYKFNVVPIDVPTGDLDIVKEVRNITDNGSFADQTLANTNDIVEYRVRVTANQSPISNVTVIDTGATGVSLTSGSLRLNGQTISGSLSSGIVVPNINTTIAQVFTYQARVTSTQCNASLVNTARASATGVNQVQDTATVIVQCINQPIPPICNPDSQTREINETAFFNASAGNGSYTWSASGSLNPTGSGSSFQTSYGSSGTKYVTVTSGGLTDTCIVIVREPTVDNPVVCSPDSQTVNINETAYFTATSGNGTYSWQANGGNPSTGNNSTFNTSYATSGTKTVTVSSSGRSDTCTVIVREPTVVTPVVCSPDIQTVDVNQYAYFNASFGNNFYSWQANGGSPSTGNEPSFYTRYSTPGTKQVVVTSDGRTDTCTVIVREISNPVECIPDFQTTDTDERVDFRVTGGNGSYFWQANGGSPSTGNDSTFYTRYSSSGLKTVSVTSDGFTDYCSVQVRNDDNDDEDAELEITKSVRNITQDISFRNTVNADDDDRIQFEVIVKNIGNDTAEDVVMRDTFPDELELDEDSVRLNGRSVNISSESNFRVELGDLSEDEDARITFEARVNTNDDDDSIRNLARATASNADSVEDDAFVRIRDNNDDDDEPELHFSKKVRNDRTLAEGTSINAEREDYLTYTLTVTNNGDGTRRNFVITDDLSGVLAFADMVDLGGGRLNGNTITFPSENISRGETVRKTFRVRVKYHLNSSQSFVLQNTYGNLVTVNVPGQYSIPFIAPKTGSSGTSAAVFAGLLTSGFVVFRKRRQLMNLIFV